MRKSALRRLTSDADMAGENLARTVRVIAKLLLDWSIMEGQRRLSRRRCGDPAGVAPSAPPVPDLPPMQAIPFDKLAQCYGRLWNELYSRGHVRYRAACLTRRGFHGPGQAVAIDRAEDERLGLGTHPDDLRRSKWAFTIEIVEKLKPGVGDERILFRLERPAWDPTCRVHPQLEPSVWDAWAHAPGDEDADHAFLTSQELEHVTAASSALASLTAGQVRALGTHSSADGTCRDIEFNLNAWARQFAVVVEVLGGQLGDADRAAYRLVTTSAEVLRKADTNRAAYAKARTSVLKALPTHQVAHAAFQAVQHDPADIWDDGRIGRYREEAPALLALSQYCRRGLCELGIAARITKRERRESDEAFTTLTERFATTEVSVGAYGMVTSGAPSDWARSLLGMKEHIIASTPYSQSLGEMGVP